MQFHSYLLSTDGGAPAPSSLRPSGRRRHPPGDGGARRCRLPRLRRRLTSYPGVPSLLRP